MELPATPRSSKEVDFFVYEAACEKCGKRGVTQEMPGYRRGVFTAVCAHCGTPREFRFAPLEPHQNAPTWHLGPEDEPSKLFDAATFRAVADRELALVPDDPAELPTLALSTSGRAHLGNARVALNELAKFQPGDGGMQAEIRRVAELYEAYDRAREAVDARPGAHPPPTGLDGRFAQHRAWLKRERVGDGHLVFRNEEWSGLRMTTNDVTGALFEDTTFNAIDFSFGVFRETTMRRTRFLGCNLMQTELDGAVIERCDFTDSRLGLATLVEVIAVGGDWQRITGGRSTWSGRFSEIDLRDASLRDSVMDDAVFETCDLRGSDVRRLDPVLRRLGTARRTRFVDCDLRGLRIEGWRLDGTIFERCRMHGLEGTPVLEGDVQLIDCDFSAAGDGGADDIGAARVLEVSTSEMTTDQALAYPGELLAVWDSSAHEEQLLVYSNDGGRLTRLSAEPMSKARRAELTFELRGRGLRQGAASMPGPFVWSTDGGVTVWALLAPHGVVAEGKDDLLTTRAGARLRRDDVAGVTSFFDEASPGHRGVHVATRSGATIVIADEHSKAAELDPTYGIDHVMIEGAWATFLGRDLAKWLGVPHTDELP